MSEKLEDAAVALACQVKATFFKQTSSHLLPATRPHPTTMPPGAATRTVQRRTLAWTRLRARTCSCLSASSGLNALTIRPPQGSLQARSRRIRAPH